MTDSTHENVHPAQERVAEMNLHIDDRPAVLELLRIVIGGRQENPAGYRPHEHGVLVDWDALNSSWLSSTEKAVVHIARGLAQLEMYGSGPANIDQAIQDCVDRVIDDRSGLG